MNKILSAIYVFLVTVSAVNGDTPLELAVQKDDIETVKILINSGANIHVTDEYGDTLLDRALFADRIEIAELLKSKGAKAPNFEEEQNQMDQYKSRKLGIQQNLQNGNSQNANPFCPKCRQGPD